MAQQPHLSFFMVILVLCVALVGVMKLRMAENQHGQNGAYGEWSVMGIHGNHSHATSSLYVIFHVGPAKIGSTSIQLNGLQKYEKQLRRDNYNVLDFRIAAKLNQCLTVRNVQTCQSQPDKEWSQFVDFLQESKRRKRHIVISTESYWNFLCNDTSHVFAAYQTAFDQFNYQVRIVIGYRPLFDYWPSVYFQQYNHYCGYSHHDVGTIPSLVNFWQHTNETTTLQHPSYAALQLARDYFTDVYILPLGDSFVERFLCDAMIGATHACHAVQSNQEDEQHILNRRHSLVSDRLAQAAISRNLSSFPCKKLSNRIQQQFQANATLLQDLPRTTCLDEPQQEWLWNKTLFYHHELILVDGNSSNDEVSLWNFYQNDNTTMCEINVEQVLVNHPQLFHDRT